MPEHEMEYCPQRELTCEFCGCGVRACEMSVHLGDCSELLWSVTEMEPAAFPLPHRCNLKCDPT